MLVVWNLCCFISFELCDIFSMIHSKKAVHIIQKLSCFFFQSVKQEDEVVYAGIVR